MKYILIAIVLMLLSSSQAHAVTLKGTTSTGQSCKELRYNTTTKRWRCFIDGRSKGYITVFEQTPFGNYEGDVVGGVIGFQTLDTGVITRDHMKYKTNGICSSDWTVKTTKGWYPLVDLYR